MSSQKDVRGKAQVEVEPIDYWSYVRSVPPAQIGEKEREQYHNREKMLLRAAKERKAQLARLIWEQEKRRYLDYRARVYGDGERAKPRVLVADSSRAYRRALYLRGLIPETEQV